MKKKKSKNFVLPPPPEHFEIWVQKPPKAERVNYAREIRPFLLFTLVFIIKGPLIARENSYGGLLSYLALVLRPFLL